MAENRVIGCQNRLPWHLPADLKRFRELTWGKPLLMGRRTHESIGRPLPGRQNIVLTSDPRYIAPGCLVLHSQADALIHIPSDSELMVIGGAGVYEAFMPLAHRLYLTTIHRNYDGDVHFPSYDPTEWLASSSEHVRDDPDFRPPHTFEALDRLPRAAAL
jgi:dihydrofolate reductase